MTTRRGVVPAVVLAVLMTSAAAAPLLAPYQPDDIDLANRRTAPSWQHWFGTDDLGRDVLTRTLYGARVSLAIGLLSASIVALVGTGIGATSGYTGGWWDGVLMRLTDTMLAIPRLPLLMVMAAIVEPSVLVLIVFVGSVGWMETARVVRAEVLSLRERAFVEAARAAGARHVRLLFHHILPAAAPAAIVAATLAVGRGILLESAMSFFGVGVQPPQASWGNMLYQAQSTMATEPWVAIFPGALIFITVLAVNALGARITDEQIPAPMSR